MKQWKKLFAVMTAGTMILGGAVCVCGEDTSEDTAEASVEESEKTEEEASETAQETGEVEEETPEMIAQAKAEALLAKDWFHGAWVRVYRDEDGRLYDGGDDIMFVMPDNTVYYGQQSGEEYSKECVLSVEGDSVSIDWDETSAVSELSEEEIQAAKDMEIEINAVTIEEEHLKNKEELADTLYAAGDYYEEAGVDKMLVMQYVDLESDPMNPSTCYYYYMKQKQGMLESAAAAYLKLLFSGTSWELNGKVLEIGADPVEDELGEVNSLYRTASMDNGAYTGTFSFGTHSLITADLNFEWDNAESGHYWFAGTEGDTVTLVKADDANTQVVMTKITKE